MHQFAPQHSLKPFTPVELKTLLDALERHRPQGRAVAGFDADGTLWNTDMGEAFFNYIIERKLVPLPPDPWGVYNRMKVEQSHTAAYVWLAQILAGVPLATVRQWSEDCVAAGTIPVFDEQMRVLEKLKELRVEIYLVTASITWAVEPAARRIGLTDEQVIGIETEVDGGVITDQAKGVITFRRGKAEALLARTHGVKPYFCSGNTEGDFFLLEASTDLRLVISSAPEGTENYPTEKKMLDLAAERGWFSHRY